MVLFIKKHTFILMINHRFYLTQVIDWYFALKKVILDDCVPFSHSSTLNHFFMDGATYDSAYLHIVNDMAELRYVDREQEHWYWHKDLEGIEFFVPDGTKWTWKELQEYCNDIKK